MSFSTGQNEKYAVWFTHPHTARAAMSWTQKTPPSSYSYGGARDARRRGGSGVRAFIIFPRHALRIQLRVYIKALQEKKNKKTTTHRLSFLFLFLSRSPIHSPSLPSFTLSPPAPPFAPPLRLFHLADLVFLVVEREDIRGGGRPPGSPALVGAPHVAHGHAAAAQRRALLVPVVQRVQLGVRELRGGIRGPPAARGSA